MTLEPPHPTEPQMLPAPLLVLPRDVIISLAGIGVANTTVKPVSFESRRHLLVPWYHGGQAALRVYFSRNRGEEKRE